MLVVISAVVDSLAVMRLTAETALSLSCASPINPANSTFIISRTRTMMAAVHGFTSKIEMTTKTASVMIITAFRRFHFRVRYCSQKVNGMPRGKLGRPWSLSNSSQMPRTS